MLSQDPTKVFIIGGTGAQGIPVIKALVSDKKYSCLVLTRDPNSPRVKSLLGLPNVELLTGTFTEEPSLRTGFQKCGGAFVNIDGFNSGEKSEIYWAIRAYEIALEEGVSFFVYGNLEYALKKSGYDSRFRTGHYDGKGRVGEWILFQNRENSKRMKAATFTTRPYMEIVISSQTLMTPTIEDDVVTWRVPLGDGAVLHVALDDCGVYVRWLFDNQERANGMDLAIAIAPITYTEMATAFEKVTSHKAQYINTSLEDYFTKGTMNRAADFPAGYNADPKDPATMNARSNFTGFWNIWKYRVLDRDYRLLDEIHPTRIRSAEEWFRKENANGRARGDGGLWERIQHENLKPILKLAEDGRKGRL